MGTFQLMNIGTPNSISNKHHFQKMGIFQTVIVYFPILIYKIFPIVYFPIVFPIVYFPKMGYSMIFYDFYDFSNSISPNFPPKDGDLPDFPGEVSPGFREATVKSVREQGMMRTLGDAVEAGMWDMVDV